MSDHKQISDLLHNSSVNLNSLKNYIQFKEQVQEKELKHLRQQLLQDPKVILDSSTLPSFHTSSNNEHSRKEDKKSSNINNYTTSKTINPDDNDDSFSLSSSSSSTSSDDKHNL